MTLCRPALLFLAAIAIAAPAQTTTAPTMPDILYGAASGAGRATVCAGASGGDRGGMVEPVSGRTVGEMLAGLG